MNFIRLPFRWERLQHTNSAVLDPTEFGRMNTFVTNATTQGMTVLLDPHNFMRYYPNPRSAFQTSTNYVGDYVGTTTSNADFANFWSQLAVKYKTNSRVYFGLNNEPDALPEASLVTSENIAIAAIRSAGATNVIFVPGNAYTGAWTWSNTNGVYGAANSVAMLGIVDPGNNYVYEVHQYLDSDGSGTHTNIVSVDIGWQRLTNFTAWARANNFRGFLGEYAVPGDTLGGTNIGGQAVTNMLTYIRTNSDVWLGWAYWGGGPWWGSNPLFPIEPLNIGQPNQTDQPAMVAIESFFPPPMPSLAATAVILTSGANPSTYGNAVAFTATVQTNGVALSGISGESIKFYDAKTLLGSGTLNGSGQASYATIPTQLSAVTHSITAQYAGDATYAGSTNSPVLSQTVNPLGLTVTNVVAMDKVYDGTTNDVLNTTNAGLDGVVNGDSVTLVASTVAGYFADANVGTNKPVTVVGLTLGGVAAANYLLIEPTNVTASILPLVMPVFVSPGIAGFAGGWQLNFNGQAGQSYHVLASSNLALPSNQWTVLTNALFGSDGTATFTDTSATNLPQRFYQIVSP
jgi:hypothetical protein